MKNVYVLSDETHKVQTTTHKNFDNGHISSHAVELPHMAQSLQLDGYNNAHTGYGDWLYLFEMEE